MTSSGADGVAPADAGAAPGLVNTVRRIGSALSLSTWPPRLPPVTRPPTSRPTPAQP
ncbi:hypothetical protein ACIREE_29525 [Streptomyces sp. NPDC102467]|uniref:hypothetical protein n=1 Tax=Streptomyces sp. NPDC102467 TaxID=3366179 RepID=UPI0037FCAA2C